MPTTGSDILMRAVMSNVTGLVEDEVVNDFAFRWPFGGVPSNANLDLLMAAVSAFYRDVQAGGHYVGEFIASTINRAATHRIEAVRIDLMGSPIRDWDWLGPGPTIYGSNDLPNEVAGVLSFHANLTGLVEEVGDTRPKARRRGRVYIGPLVVPAVTAGPNPKLSDEFRQCLAEAAGSLRDNAGAIGFDWSVWSRAANDLYTVVGGWTDNAPDSQRRRGQAPTARATFIV